MFTCFFMIWLLTKFLTWDNPYSILTKLEEDWTKTVASRVFTRFFYDLTYWPSFWPNITHTQSWLSLIKTGAKLWPLECSQVFFYDLTYWPSFWPGMIHILSWPSSMKIGQILWPQECSHGFSMIWPTDLVLDPMSPIFELDKMIVLSKFNEDWTKTVASRVFTRFFYDLTYWPTFWPDMTNIQSWPRYCQDDHSE